MSGRPPLPPQGKHVPDAFVLLKIIRHGLKKMQRSESKSREKHAECSDISDQLYRSKQRVKKALHELYIEKEQRDLVSKLQLQLQRVCTASAKLMEDHEELMERVEEMTLTREKNARQLKELREDQAKFQAQHKKITHSRRSLVNENERLQMENAAYRTQNIGLMDLEERQFLHAREEERNKLLRRCHDTEASNRQLKSRMVELEKENTNLRKTLSESKNGEWFSSTQASVAPSIVREEEDEKKGSDAGGGKHSENGKLDDKSDKLTDNDNDNNDISSSLVTADGDDNSDAGDDECAESYASGELSGALESDIECVDNEQPHIDERM